jgi:phosphoglucosamine mutase
MAHVESARLGKAKRVDDAAGRYIEFCKSTIPTHMQFRGMKIVVDSGHGATYHIAPNVFEELGARVVPLGNRPDGLNINDKCGSTHPEKLREQVLETQADLGVAFDGDGDRVIMVDHTGNLVDGDEILYIIAQARHGEGKLKGDVIGTVMSNLGLEHALGRHGLKLQRAAVGDRYVLEMMQREGSVLGGESSGHIICLYRTTTGDGIVSALQVLAAMNRSGKSLRDLRSAMTKYPQVLVNVRMDRKFDVAKSDIVSKAVQAAELKLAGSGRILLRPSGTEPLVRVMVEGNDMAQVKSLAEEIAEVVRKAVKAG